MGSVRLYIAKPFCKLKWYIHTTNERQSAMLGKTGKYTCLQFLVYFLILACQVVGNAANDLILPSFCYHYPIPFWRIWQMKINKVASCAHNTPAFGLKFWGEDPMDYFFTRHEPWCRNYNDRFLCNVLYQWPWVSTLDSNVMCHILNPWLPVWLHKRAFKGPFHHHIFNTRFSRF